MKLTEARKLLKEEFSHATVRADGTATVKDFYFFHCGRTLDKFEARIKKVCPNAEIIERGDDLYNSSNRLWYMQITFKPNFD